MQRAANWILSIILGARLGAYLEELRKSSLSGFALSWLGIGFLMCFIISEATGDFYV